MRCDDIRIERVAVCGWEPPHDVELTFVVRLDQAVDDGILQATREQRQQFLDMVSPTVANAFYRAFLSDDPAAAKAPRTGKGAQS